MCVRARACMSPFREGEGGGGGTPMPSAAVAASDFGGFSFSASTLYSKSDNGHPCPMWHMDA